MSNLQNDFPEHFNSPLQQVPKEINQLNYENHETHRIERKPIRTHPFEDDGTINKSDIMPRNDGLMSTPQSQKVRLCIFWKLKRVFISTLLRSIP